MLIPMGVPAVVPAVEAFQRWKWSSCIGNSLHPCMAAWLHRRLTRYDKTELFEQHGNG